MISDKTTVKDFVGDLYVSIGVLALYLRIKRDNGFRIGFYANPFVEERLEEINKAT